MIQLKENTIICYFGTFNPVHVGHMIIGQYMLENTSAKELWYIVSPQNPLKSKTNLLPDRQRLHMVNLAIYDPYNIKSSDIEFSLSKPSYTTSTLAHLKELYPEKNFAIIMGSDNLVNFHRWKNYEAILDQHQILVYPRLGHNTNNYEDHPHVHKVDAPFVDISSTIIRNAVRSGKNVSQMLPPKVWDYIESSNFYI